MKVEYIIRDKKTGKFAKKKADTKSFEPRQRSCVELVEGSGLRQWAHENEGACFVWAGGKPFDGEVGWVTYYLDDEKSLRALLRSVNHLVKNVTGGTMEIQVIEKP